MSLYITLVKDRLSLGLVALCSLVCRPLPCFVHILFQVYRPTHGIFRILRGNVDTGGPALSLAGKFAVHCGVNPLFILLINHPFASLLTLRLRWSPCRGTRCLGVFIALQVCFTTVGLVASSLLCRVCRSFRGIIGLGSLTYALPLPVMNSKNRYCFCANCSP